MLSTYEKTSGAGLSTEYFHCWISLLWLLVPLFPTSFLQYKVDARADEWIFHINPLRSTCTVSQFSSQYIPPPHQTRCRFVAELQVFVNWTDLKLCELKCFAEEHNTFPCPGIETTILRSPLSYAPPSVLFLVYLNTSLFPNPPYICAIHPQPWPSRPVKFTLTLMTSKMESR